MGTEVYKGMGTVETSLLGGRAPAILTLKAAGVDFYLGYPFLPKRLHIEYHDILSIDSIVGGVKIVGRESTVTFYSVRLEQAIVSLVARAQQFGDRASFKSPSRRLLRFWGMLYVAFPAAIIVIIIVSVLLALI